MLLLTGATGLVGSFTVRRLLQENYKIRALVRPGADRSLLSDVENQVNWCEGDVLDVLSLERALEGVTQVIHAAAVVSFVPKDRRTMYKINVEGTANVVNACLRAGVKKLVYVSSVAALGRSNKPGLAIPQIIDETSKWEDSPLNSHYAKTKYGAELEVWRASSEGLPVVVVNPSVILGEGDWQRSSTQLFKYAYDEHVFYPAGSLNYVDVFDVAEAIFRLLTSEIKNERFVLNAGSLPYRDFLEKTAQAFGKKSPTMRVPGTAAAVLWRLEALRSWLTGKAPLLTRETAQSASHSYFYPNEKIRQAIRLEFRPLAETLSRVTASLHAPD
ncbi:MAG: NAD-dependent epimerase/dehydratase family protein [Sphingobacteriaceae bacterium]|nr:NAD-dependent epimerase/dehydratase family protein [Cytophagaceae bacterium]